MVFSAIISVMTIFIADDIKENKCFIFLRILLFLNILATINGIRIIFVLGKNGLKINAKIEKFLFSSRGANNYRISYIVDENIYYGKATQYDDMVPEKIEIIVSKKYPWIIIDKFSRSLIVKVALIWFLVADIFYFLTVILSIFID